MERKTYTFGDVVVDAGQFRVTKAGRPLDLEPKAIEVLLFLIEHRERLVLKEELLDAVWPQTFVTPNALTRVIAQVRKALEDDAQEAHAIETVPRKGYRFLPDVSVSTSNTASSSASATPPIVSANDVAAVRPSVQRRQPAFIWRIALLTLVIGAAVALAALAMRRSSTHPPMAVTDLAQITSASGYEAQPALSPDGRRLAYTSDESGTKEIYVRPLGQGDPIQVTRDGGQNVAAAWSPDGESIAYHSEEKGGIWIAPALGGTPRLLVASGSDPDWSPDGSTLAVSTFEGALAEQATIVLVSASSGRATALTKAGQPRGGHRMPAWSPDGRWIAFHAYDGAAGSGLWVISVDGGNPIRVATMTHPAEIAFAPDGRTICWTGTGPDINIGLWCVPVNGSDIGEPVAVLQGVSGISGLSIARDGTIAYGVQRMESDLWNLPLSPSTGEPAAPPAPLMRDTNRNTHPVFSPNGRSLAFLNWRPGTPSEIWLMDMTSGRSELLAPGAGAEFYGTWLPDNRRLLAMSIEDGKRRCVQLSVDTRQIEELTALPTQMANLAVSPDGHDLAYHVPSESGAVATWRVPLAGGEPVRLTPPSMSAGYPAWSRDGRLIALEVADGRRTQIWTMNRDGSGIRQLTSENGQHWPHSWAPDNDRIAFAGTKDGMWNVYTVSASTGAIRQLTKLPRANSYVRYPAWSPLNDRIVFEYAVTTGNLWTGRLTGSVLARQ